MGGSSKTTLGHSFVERENRRRKDDDLVRTSKFGLRPYISPDRWTSVSPIIQTCWYSRLHCPSVWRHIEIALQLAMAHTTTEIADGMAGNLLSKSQNLATGALYKSSLDKMSQTQGLIGSLTTAVPNLIRKECSILHCFILYLWLSLIYTRWIRFSSISSFYSFLLLPMEQNIPPNPIVQNVDDLIRLARYSVGIQYLASERYLCLRWLPIDDLEKWSL